MARIEIGKHLAADTRVCRGRLIFKGTRILVSDALELTKAGYTPEKIARQYRGMITPKGVRRRWRLPTEALSEKSLLHQSPSLDYPIRSRQHVRRYRQADLLGGLEIDDQLELRRLLDGKIGGLGAFQNLVHVNVATRRYKSM